MDFIEQGDPEAIAEYSATLIGDDEDQGREAAKELGKLGRGGAHALLEVAQDRRASVRANVAYGIRWLGVYRIGWTEDIEKKALATINDLLEDVDLDVRAQACVSLYSFEESLDRAVIMRLVDILRDGVEAEHRGPCTRPSTRSVGLAWWRGRPRRPSWTS